MIGKAAFSYGSALAVQKLTGLDEADVANLIFRLFAYCFSLTVFI
jgi:hypothetical protein